MLTKEYLHQPVIISTVESEPEPINWEQHQHFFLRVGKPPDKLKTWLDLLGKLPSNNHKVVTFCHNHKCGWLAYNVNKNEQRALYLHNNLDWTSRAIAIGHFFTKEPYKILVTTDVPSRIGTLIPHLEDIPSPLIINYDLPEKKSVYGDRILSTIGGQGLKCVVINFITDRDQRRHLLQGIEKQFGIKIGEMPSNVAHLF